MKRTSVASAFCMSFALPVTAQVSDEARAHIKCFASLTQGLFMPEMKKANSSLERQRQRHEELFIQIGRQNLKGSNFKFGIDHYLGGYEQRVFDSQIAKIQCDNPNPSVQCTDWVTKPEKLLSAIGMKF